MVLRRRWAPPVAAALALAAVGDVARELSFHGVVRLDPDFVVVMLVGWPLLSYVQYGQSWPGLSAGQARRLEDAIDDGRLPEDAALLRALRRDLPRVREAQERERRVLRVVLGLVLVALAAAAAVLGLVQPPRLGARLLGLALTAAVWGLAVALLRRGDARRRARLAAAAAALAAPAA